MGRRYYCEYCDKSFVETSESVKKHRNGLLHQKLLKEHYNKFKDAQTLLKEESSKNQCNRFQKTGECGFGSNCRYSHYTKEQLDYLRWEVQQNKVDSYEKSGTNRNSASLETWFMSRRQRNLNDSPALSKLFTDSLPSYDVGNSTMTPWQYMPKMNDQSDLPPSLNRFINIGNSLNSKHESWG